MKNKNCFDSHIEAIEKKIDKIQSTSNFTSREKNDLTAKYRRDISNLEAAQLAIANRELRRKKQAQLAQLHRYETIQIK